MLARFRRPLSLLAATCFAGLALSASTGCASVSANTSAASAAKDAAPMAIVVRRADAANATVHEVNRLLAWTPSGEHANLLETISPALADGFSHVMGKKLALASIDARLEQERRTIAAADISADDKTAHETALLELQKQRANDVAALAPLEKAFLATAKDAAKEVSADQRETLVPTLAALLVTLRDADVANSAAAVRYPLAVPSMMTSVNAVVPGIVADIVEEQTGTRPDATKLTPHVVETGPDVSVSIGGLGPKDLGSLQMDSLTRETMSRTASWVTHATTLLATIDSTKDALSFETDTLTQIMAGIAPVVTPASTRPTEVASAAVPGNVFGMVAETK